MVAGQAEASCARETSPVIDAGAILALQEHAGQDAGPAADLADREARRHGQNLLEALAALQKELLAGGDPVLSLSRLSALAGMTMAAHDPALAHILASIRLRARLEILRLARGSVPAEPGSWPAGMARTVKGS
jgi:methionyl-tRNA formyltransferase